VLLVFLWIPEKSCLLQAAFRNRRDNQNSAAKLITKYSEQRTYDQDFKENKIRY